jgi:hypothetical protein
MTYDSVWLQTTLTSIVMNLLLLAFVCVAGVYAILHRVEIWDYLVMLYGTIKELLTGKE